MMLMSNLMSLGSTRQRMKGKEKYVLVYKKNLAMYSRGFRATRLSTYDLSTLYTTVLHNLMRENFLI